MFFIQDVSHVAQLAAHAVFSVSAYADVKNSRLDHATRLQARRSSATPAKRGRRKTVRGMLRILFSTARRHYGAGKGWREGASFDPECFLRLKDVKA